MNYSMREELWQRLEVISPLSLAGSWDNVGVLLDPPQKKSIKVNQEKIILTIETK